MTRVKRRVAPINGPSKARKADCRTQVKCYREMASGIHTYMGMAYYFEMEGTFHLLKAAHHQILKLAEITEMGNIP